MISIQIHKTVTDVFSVLNAQKEPVAGIEPSDFIVTIYDPLGNKNSIPSDIVELGDGHYRISFVPDSVGQWYVVVSHGEYFPWGKSASYQIFNEDLESIAANVNFIKDIEGGRWKIDSTRNEMIFFQDDNETEIARFKLLDNKGNPSSQAVFERLRI